MEKRAGIGERALDFERLFDTLPSPHMVLDRSLRFVAANRAYEQVTMRDREELIGRELFKLFPNEGEGGRRVRESIERVFDTGEPDTLAYIAYDIPRPAGLGGGMEQRYWTAVHVPLAGDDGTVSHILQNTTDVTEIVQIRQAAALPYRLGEAHLLERAREAEQQHRAQLAESEDFRRLFQMAPGFFAVLSGPDHEFVFANDAYVRLVGGRSVVGRTVRAALPEIEGQGFLEMLDGVYRSGQPAGGEGVRIMLLRENGTEPAETFVDFSYDAIRNAAGQITGVFVQGMDRTGAVKTQKRQQLLLAELNHRVKNTLASVQSIVSQTLRSTTDPASARHDIEKRLLALSNAHNLLSEQEWTSTSLSDVVREGLTIVDRERYSADGPNVILRPSASIAIALIIHELAANAAKHGALAVADGRIDLNWSLADDGRFVLVWKETGGPSVRQPPRRGFGGRLIDAMVKGEFDGAFNMSFDSSGFAATICIPPGEWRKDDDD